MPRIGKLKAVEVAKAKGPTVLHDGGGLYLRVSGTGAKSWVFRFQIGGKRRDMGLGGYPDISLAEARGLAAEHRKQRHGGIDPLLAKAAQRQAELLAAARGRTFRQCAVEFIAKNRSGWRSPKHLQQWERSLKAYAYPVLGDLPVSAIDTGLVVQVLDPIWSEKPETAIRVRGRIEAVLDAAIVHGYRQGPNPAQWRGNLAHILPSSTKLRRVVHHAALPFDDMSRFLATLRTRPGMAARALEFLIFTASRPSEAVGARWGEIDFRANLWTIPAERMKAGRAHRVPLSDPALSVLEAVRPLALMQDDDTPRPTAPVFFGAARARPLSTASLLMLLCRMNCGEVTPHGFRSSFRDWCAERTNFPSEVAEMALAHRVADAVERAYRRGDLFEKRQQLMKAWASFCDAPRIAGDVVPLHAAR